MTQYYILNVKLSYSQLNKLKSGIKNGTEVTLNLSWNLMVDSNDETNFLHKSLLTDRQVSRLHKTFRNNSSANTKLSSTELSKILQLGGLWLSLSGPVLVAALEWGTEPSNWVAEILVKNAIRE